MSSYTDIFGNFNVQPSQSSYSSYTINADITLTWPLQFIDTTNIVSNIIDINALAIGLSVIMPNATMASVGSSVIFNNVGANPVTIKRADGSLLIVLANGQSAFVYLIDNTTIAGSWRTTPFGGGFVAVTSVGAISTTPDLIIAGSPITTAGNFTFSLANDLLALTQFNLNTGIASRIAANTWSLLTLTGTNNQIIVTNPQGIAGNPTFSLSPVITGINDITVGNIQINANSITSINANGEIIINPNGNGLIRLMADTGLFQKGGSASELRFYNQVNNGYVGFVAGNVALGGATIWTLPLLDGNNGQVISTNGAGILNWSSVVNFAGPSTDKAVARYSGVNGSLQNSTVIISDLGAMTGILSAVIGGTSISGVANSVITSNSLNGSISVVPDGNGTLTLGSIAGTGSVVSLLNFIISSGNSLNLFEVTNNFFVRLKSNPLLGVNLTFNLPITSGGINSLLLTDGAGNLGWTPAGAGKLVLISSQVAANSATIEFRNNNGTFPVYNSYYLVVRDLIPVNNDVAPYITFSTDGGATWANTSYYYAYMWTTPAAGPAAANSSANNAAQIVPIRDTGTTRIPNNGDTPNSPYNGIFKILNASGGNHTTITAEVGWSDTAANGRNNYSFFGNGEYRQAVAVNGVRFALSAGNISSGVFTLYGLNT